MSEVPLNALIGRIVDTAVDAARVHQPRAAVATALLGGLRRLRREVLAQAGYNASRRLDDMLGAALAADPDGDPATLPDAETVAGRAGLLIDDAVENILLVNGQTGENRAVGSAVVVLADRLCRVLGGVPDRDAVLAAITEDAETALAAHQESIRTVRVH